MMRPRIRNVLGHVVGYAAPVEVKEPEFDNPLLRKTGSKLGFVPGAEHIPADYCDARHPVAGPEGVGFLRVNFEWLGSLKSNVA